MNKKVNLKQILWPNTKNESIGGSHYCGNTHMLVHVHTITTLRFVHDHICNQMEHNAINIIILINYFNQPIIINNASLG